MEKHDFTSFSFMALVNASIFSSEQEEEGRTATERVKGTRRRQAAVCFA